MKQKLLRYFAAMNATAFDSAVHSLVLFCGVAGAEKLTSSVSAMDARQLAWIFLIAFARSLLAYLDAHPLTEFLSSSSSSSSSLAPLSSIASAKEDAHSPTAEAGWLPGVPTKSPIGVTAPAAAAPGVGVQASACPPDEITAKVRPQS